MSQASYTEDTLAHQATAEYPEGQLGWRSISVCNQDHFDPDSLPGRISDREVVGVSDG